MKFRRSLLAAALSAAFAGIAQADTITIGLATQVGSAFTYTAEVSGAGYLEPGDFFTIVDFGPISGSLLIAPAGWSMIPVAQGTGVTGSEGPANSLTQYDLDFNDSAALTNYTFKWNGPGNIPATEPSGLPGAGAPLLTVTLITSLNPFVLTPTDYISQDHSRSNPAGFGGALQNFHTENLVVPGSVVPSPAAAFGGMTLLGVLGASKVMRRRSMK